MKVSEIPSGELVVMTPELYQEFAQGGCVPACHLTNEWINIGDLFKLSTVKDWTKVSNNEFIDVMLSEKATIEDYDFKMKQILRKKLKEVGRTGCFRVNGGIVP